MPTAPAWLRIVSHAIAMTLMIVDWETGLGAFIGSSNSKSCKWIAGKHTNRIVLVVGALACGFIAGGAVYSFMICRSVVLARANHSRSGWVRHTTGGMGLVCCLRFATADLMDRALVGWCFLSAYSVAYHLLMVMVNIQLRQNAKLTG